MEKEEKKFTWKSIKDNMYGKLPIPNEIVARLYSEIVKPLEVVKIIYTGKVVEHGENIRIYDGVSAYQFPKYCVEKDLNPSEGKEDSQLIEMQLKSEMASNLVEENNVLLSKIDKLQKVIVAQALQLVEIHNVNERLSEELRKAKN